jgi:alpha/beta superfamily hydrolase
MLCRKERPAQETGGNVEEKVTIDSAGLKLAGVVHTPDNLKKGARLPAFVICHGFGGHKDGPQQMWTANKLNEWGYVALRFDFRGCGESGGPRGNVIGLEEVDDAKAAVSFMASRADVDPNRIAISGTSYGAAVAIYTAGVDKRIAAVISQGGWADGTTIAQTQHPTPEKWERYLANVEAGRRKQVETGKTQTMHRFDIVPVPERLRSFIDERSIFDFTVDTALTKFYFRPGDVIGNISPRPVLLLHAANDSVTGARGSLELYARPSRRPSCT